MNECKHPNNSPPISPRCSPETSCGLSSSSSPPRDDNDSAQQLYTMLFGAPTDDRSVDEEAHWRSDIVEWEAALAEGRRQLLNVWHCQSAPTENEFVVFTEHVVDEYCLRFDDMIAEDKLFFWWMWFRKTTMPPDATPAECAMPFLEQVDDPYKHNPTFNPRGKKQKVRLVKVSSIVSALSGDELVVAEAVRDIVEPGRKLRGWAYTVFSSSVAPLKLTRAAVLSLYVLWKVKGADKVLVTHELDEARDEIFAFARERVFASNPKPCAAAGQVDWEEVAQGRKYSDRRDASKWNRVPGGEWNEFSRFLDEIVKPHGFTFTSVDAEWRLFEQWKYRGGWYDDNCIKSHMDFFVLRLSGKVDPVYDDWYEDRRRYRLIGNITSEKPIVGTLKAILSTNEERKKFQAFTDERQPLGLTRTSICILYVLWGIVRDHAYRAAWVFPSESTMEQRWHEFFGRFKDRDGGDVLHDALSLPFDEILVPWWCLAWT